MKYKYIIWDWNGTLFDDVSICIEAMNEVLRLTGSDKILEYDEYREIFGFPVEKYYQRVGFDFTRYSFDYLANLYMDIYTARQLEARLNSQAVDTLERFHRGNAEQIVLSASETGRLLAQIDNFDIGGYFSQLLGTDNIYAVSKQGVACKWLENNQINPRDAVFIGDTVHDCEVAKAIDCNSILVSCGHQSESVLKKTGERVFKSLNDACEFVIQN